MPRPPPQAHHLIVFSLRGAVSCFHPKAKAEKENSGREERLLDAPLPTGIDAHISLKSGMGRVLGTVSGSNCC